MLVSVSVTTLQGATLGSMGVRRAVRPAGCLKLGAGRELGSRPAPVDYAALRLPLCVRVRPLVNLPGVVVWLHCCNPPQATRSPGGVRAAKRVERRRCAGRRCVEARAPTPTQYTQVSDLKSSRITR